MMLKDYDQCRAELQAQVTKNEDLRREMDIEVRNKDGAESNCRVLNNELENYK
jgi:hypothetical protein